MQQEKFDAAIDMICFSREDAQSDLRAFRDVSHFVHCSTVMTYGLEMDWLPATEDHPLRKTAPYGNGKIEADAAFMAAFYSEGFPVTIIKPSTTIGPQNGPLRGRFGIRTNFYIKDVNRKENVEKLFSHYISKDITSYNLVENNERFLFILDFLSGNSPYYKFLGISRISP